MGRAAIRFRAGVASFFDAAPRHLSGILLSCRWIGVLLRFAAAWDLASPLYGPER